MKDNIENTSLRDILLNITNLCQAFNILQVF